MADYLNDEMLPYHLTHTMFGKKDWTNGIHLFTDSIRATTIREQGNDEQRAHWLPQIEKWKIIGAYGQTEMGHGSNVRGLECQAIWQPETKDFIIHSPTLTASKVYAN
jgi:acyl-CoA oxidase